MNTQIPYGSITADANGYITRVTERMWLRMSTRIPGDLEVWESGELGARIGEFFSDLWEERTRGGTDDRRYGQFRPQWEVVGITDEKYLGITQIVGTTVTVGRTIRYEWGPPRAFITVFSSDIVDGPGRHQLKSKHALYRQSGIWKHVPTPFVP